MQAVTSAERLSHLIGLIYDAAIDADRWRGAMTAMRLELNFEIAILNLHVMGTGEVLLNITDNVPAAYIPLIETSWTDVAEQWGGVAAVAALPMHEPAVMSWVNPGFDRMTSENRYTRAFAQPQRLIDVMGIGLARDAGSLGSLAFGRHERAGPIGEREVALARLLLPHLQRAATVTRMLDRARLAQSTLASLSAPILLVSDDLRILNLNPAAERVLERGDPIRRLDGRLVTTSVGGSSALAAAIRASALGEAQIGHKGLGIPARRADGSAAALHVLPIGHRHQDATLGAIAAVFVAEAGTTFVPPSEVAAALFGLTASEARVFDAAARGATAVEIAQGLGVERSTVKSHLLRVYEKVGVRRQADLIQIAASLAAPGST